MKHLLTIGILTLVWNINYAQHQLDIQGNPVSVETVAQINVNNTGFNNITALDVHSAPQGDQAFYGVGGNFFGGRQGTISVSYSGNGAEGYSTNKYGVYGRSENFSGVYGYGSIGVTGKSNANGTGVYGESETYYGVYGKSQSSIGTRGLSGTGYGVYGKSGSSHGVYGYSTAGAGVQGYSKDLFGVNAISVNNNAIVGTSSSKVGVFAHGVTYDFFASGPGVNYGGTSSKRWKSNIINIDSPIEKLSLLRGVYFKWDKEHGGKHDIGFIAEEIGEVLPEIVLYEENGIDASGMDYSKMTPLLVEAANAMRKEYTDKIYTLELENAQLKSRIDKIEAIIAHLDITKNP